MSIRVPKSIEKVLKIAAMLTWRAALALGIVVLTGCGPQAYDRATVIQGQQSPGNYFIPPKVDILLATDDTGSMTSAYPDISAKVSQFVSELSKQNWDYHFANMPLTTRRPIRQVNASHFDPNWLRYGLWLAPYPGAQPDAIAAVSDWAFRTPMDYSDFLDSSDINSSLAGKEPGFENILNVLNDTEAARGTSSDSGFLRDDAMLVVLVVSNGQDTSRVNTCYRSLDGVEVFCESAAKPACSSISQYNPDPSQNNCGTERLSFNHYRNSLSALKASSSLLKFYAAVGDGSRDCLGGGSRPGSRYREMANSLGGKDYNICKQSLTTVLDNLKNDLQATRGSFRTRYLVLETEPDLNSIQVTIYRDGQASQAESIPFDPENGWTYVGYMEGVPTIDSPVLMNPATGFFLELHGTAKLLGNDTADVTYQAAGAQDSTTL